LSLKPTSALFAADGHTLKSVEVTSSSVSSPAVDAVQPYLSLVKRSRKSLSLDNLQMVGADSPGDDPSLQSQSVMYARNMNQSFRVAVDKSFDGPSLVASLAGWC